MRTGRCATTFVAMTVMVFCSLAGAGAQDLGLDHFQCYRITQGTPANDFVLLHDQFDVTPNGNVFEHVIVQNPLLFCNPVKKTTSTGQTTPIVNENNHLELYYIAPTTGPTRTVTVTNQFTGSALTPLVVFQPFALAVPTQKRPHDPPERLDHFKCYIVQGSPVDVPVRLADQWGTHAARVGRPVLLCNPTVKVHIETVAGAAGEREVPITNPDAHLVCYRILTPNVSPNRAVQVRNQFDKDVLKVAQPVLLCVPSRKQVPTG
jgi:hypothetical protein